MSKKVKEWLYTDTPPKFTPSKLNVNFLERVAPAGISRTGFNGGIKPFLLANEPNFTIDIQRRKNTH